MSSVAFMIFYLALSAAAASWLVAFVFYLRTLSSLRSGQRSVAMLALFAWPFAIRKLRGMAAAHAITVHRALISFMVSVLVALAAAAAAINLQRVGG